MTWSTLQDKARAMGFELACHENARSTPPGGGAWFRVGSYAHGAPLWAQATTAQARAMSPVSAAAMLSTYSEHVETMGDYDEDFHAALAPVRAALDNPDHGRMPA